MIRVFRPLRLLVISDEAHIIQPGSLYIKPTLFPVYVFHSTSRVKSFVIFTSDLEIRLLGFYFSIASYCVHVLFDRRRRESIASSE